MYSFFMSNKAWDRSTEFSANPLGEGNTDRLIKNLGLKVGQKFMYIFDYGDEHFFEIEVLSKGLEGSESVEIGIIETKGTPPEQYANYW